jgi:tetratricopeptide (TPR) repeat protein
MILSLFVGFSPCRLFGEKVLMYDEQRGVIFVDKDSLQESKEAEDVPQEGKSSDVQAARRPRSSSMDIHSGRRKDPPEVYFSSGLQYFQDGDYENALKNFMYADSLDPQPTYSLWIGKTYRRMQKYERMLFIMNKILNTSPQSDVADDALFEIAFYHQLNNDYYRAQQTYARLAEQYPFGRAFSNGEEFREVARKQRQAMRAEILSTLGILGFTGTDDMAELYREFQQSYSLPVTGVGDRQTIQAIKSLHQEYRQEEQQKTAYIEAQKKHVIVVASVGSVFILLTVFFVLVRVSMNSKRTLLKSLYRTLTELNTTKI